MRIPVAVVTGNNKTRYGIARGLFSEEIPYVPYPPLAPTAMYSMSAPLPFPIPNAHTTLAKYGLPPHKIAAYAACRTRSVCRVSEPPVNIPDKVLKLVRLKGIRTAVL